MHAYTHAHPTVDPTYTYYVHRYSVVGFIDKNKDTLYQDFKRLLYNW